METVLWCKDPLKKGCHWSGDGEELVAANDSPDDRDFSHCPGCGGTDFEEEEVEE